MAAFHLLDENFLDTSNVSPVHPASEDSVVKRPRISLEENEKTAEQLMEESERLAWELMQQDSLDAYRAQAEFLAQNTSGIDAEDLAAIELAMAEERSRIHVQVDAQEEEDEENEETEGSENWTYEQLLALGETLGGMSTTS